MHLWPDEVFNIKTVPVFMNYSAVHPRSVVNLTQSTAELFVVVALLVAADCHGYTQHSSSSEADGHSAGKDLRLLWNQKTQ
jgi:hypothetical protein